jgi:hypothetical protein
MAMNIHVSAVLPFFGMAKEGHEHQSHPGPVGSINLGISATCGNHGMSTLDIPRLISFGSYPQTGCATSVSQPNETDKRG